MPTLLLSSALLYFLSIFCTDFSSMRLNLLLLFAELLLLLLGVVYFKGSLFVMNLDYFVSYLDVDNGFGTSYFYLLVQVSTCLEL